MSLGFFLLCVAGLSFLSGLPFPLQALEVFRVFVFLRMAGQEKVQ